MGQYNPDGNPKINYLDKENYSLAQRKQFYKDAIERDMNPVKSNFNPETFEPSGDPDIKEVSFRVRKPVPKLLPTFGLNPKELLEGQMIGMFESKQDLYLILAHRCNELQAEIDLLKTKIK